jgi:hypothetical protein
VPRPFLRAVALLGASLAALAPLTGPALAAGSGRAAGSVQATRSAQDAGSARPAPASRLLLINGTWAATGDNSDRPVIFPAGRGLTGTVEVLRLGSRSLVIPMAALPFVGRGLSPSLFELSALARAERDGRLPLTLRFRARLHAPPGMSVTRTGPGTAEGYLTAAGARKLGAALARQLVADHDRGSYGTDGLFAGGLSLALRGTPSALVADRPSFPMHTLTVTATTMNGKPDTGDLVFVLNVTNGGAIGVNTFNFFYHGSVKFSVPGGTYWAIGLFTPVHGHSEESRVDVLPQFTVRGNAAVHLSARAATSKIGFAVPRRANLLADELTITRVTHGNGFALSLLNTAARGSLWVSPVTRAPTDGVLHAYTTGWLTSPGHRAVPYTYSLSRADPAGLILRDQRYIPRPGDLATVRENYFQDVRSTSGLSCTTPADSGDAFDLGICISAGMRRPGSQVQYFTARPASLWSVSYWEYGVAVGGQYGAFRLLHAGEQLTEEWNRYPLHAAPNVLLPGSREIFDVPSAIRAGNMLSLQIIPFSDNTYGHLGTGFSTGLTSNYKVSGRYAIYQDGVRIAGGNAVQAARGMNDLDVQARLSPRPSVIKLVLIASRASRSFPLSAASRDVWTWPSRPEPRATLTAPWICRLTRTGVDEHCAVQGMLTLRYFVAGLSPSGTTTPGRQQIILTVDHLAEARSSRISAVRAQVSFTGGRTWQQANVQPEGPARFSVAFAGSPSLVTLRVTARDAAGDTITETLPAAYRIAPATGLPPTSPALTGPSQARPHAPHAAGALHTACPAARPGRARCLVMYRTPPQGTGAAAAAGPSGLTPRDLWTAYRLPFRRDSRQTVAIVDAFRTPHLRQYLAYYRRHFGLPPCGRGCLKIVNQRGAAAPLPRSGSGSGWDLETTLDVDMVSVACPRCHILLVQARSDRISDMAASENTAARLGAPVISNSYGIQEGGYEMTFAKAYDHPGHTIVLSAGDSGFGQADFPADLATVTAVGGTQLRRSGDARRWSERVWNQHDLFGGAGASGCSAYVAKPAWQHDPHCPGRTVADVSAVASNIPIYDKVWGGWITVGGTSVAAPLIAGIYGLAGNAARLSPGSLYQHRHQLFDITTGNNAFLTPPKATCGDDYLCVAKRGYDAPTGLGTPNGAGAF